MTPIFFFPQKAREIWLWWILATVAGELIGFAIPSILGPLAVYLLQGMTGIQVLLITLVIATVAGIGEGAVLGFAQSIILRRYIKEFARGKWTLATAIAAALAWIMGMLPSSIENIGKLNMIVLVIGFALLGILFLLSIGFAQWLVLRHYVPGAGSWILINAIAWPIGVAVPVITLSLVPENSGVVIWVIVGVLSGVLMGVVVGAITGSVLVKLLERKNQKDLTEEDKNE